jgi:hypothetical protein
MPGLWIGGSAAYEDALKKRRNENVASLKDKLARTATLEESRQLELEIQQEHESYKEKLAKIDRSLF